MGPGLCAPPTLFNPWGGKFSVRPALSGLSGDGSSFIAGPDRHIRQTRRGWYGHIIWTRWTQTQAVGHGAHWLNNCKPACVNGRYYAYPIELRAYAPNQLGRFARLWMRERYHGRWRTSTAKLIHAGDTWYWG